ncbi:DUF5004 domain-containing protein [Flavobacterium soli]|uniref:DUF5004 domain-containing protein n=1 Tax=Flavobacterium soli TaxID=344881 RepID=UPI0004221A6B|nr:DUF5004 domain-containing protein [Flavobacterium soli]
MKCKLLYGLAMVCLLAFGCSKNDDGSHVAPITLYEKVNGNWGLMNLKMVDEFAKKNAIEPSEQNLSSMFNYADFKINFNVDEKMQPTSYEVLGDVPPLFAPTGYWELSAAFQPTGQIPLMIYLYSDVQKTQKTDELRLSSVPGSNGEMEIQLTRTSEGTPFITYIFKLNTLNE